MIELMIVVVIIGILATLGYNGYSSMVDNARNVAAMGDIKAISYAVDDYYVQFGTFPTSLAVVGHGDTEDPWGNPYEFQVISGPGGGTRKDKNLVPINSDYDLYSMGADGRSAPPLTANHSKDDIIRANNGGFIGLAINY